MQFSYKLKSDCQVGSTNSMHKFSSTGEPHFMDTHPLNTDTLLLQTVYFIPGESPSLHFL